MAAQQAGTASAVAEPVQSSEGNYAKTVWIMLAIGIAIAVVGWFLAG